jgi:hypothetical protein
MIDPRTDKAFGTGFMASHEDSEHIGHYAPYIPITLF